LSIVGILMLSGSLSLTTIVDSQAKGLWYIILQPIAFVIFLISAIAETNRAPFDLVEAEQELVGGYHTEYTGLRFALFFMAEYINMVTASALVATLFLGGWRGPFDLLSGPWWLLIKIIAVLTFYVVLRATLPRLRYDQLMRLGWHWLLPIALLNVVLTAIGITLFGG
jgi:NADH-quinone oxidoreductase subunit H